MYQVSQAQTAGRVKRNKKIRTLFLHVLVQSSYILDVVGKFWIWSSTNMPRSLLGSSRAFDFVWLCHLCDLLSRSTHGHYATSQRHDLWVTEWKSHRGAGGAPSNSSLMLFEKVNFRATTPCSRNRESNFFLTDLLTFFLFSSSENCLKNVATDFFLFLSSE